MTDYAHSESLVSTKWLVDHLDNSQLSLVEVVWGTSPSYGRPAYEKGHIPGALAWDFEKDLKNNAQRDFPNKDDIEAVLSRSGITPETTIILYSGLNNLLATYAFWILKIYGHKDVRLLDGDRDKWLDENRPVTSEEPLAAPARYQAKEPDLSIRADRNTVLQSMSKANHILIDARTVEMYNGLDKSGAARGGHIPGSVNFAARRETNPDGSFRAWRVMTVKPDGSFRTEAELRALFEILGITSDKENVIYCVRGGLSTHAWFVLTQLLGYSHVREYETSWMEWGNIEELPIAT